MFNCFKGLVVMMSFCINAPCDAAATACVDAPRDAATTISRFDDLDDDSLCLFYKVTVSSLIDSIINWDEQRVKELEKELGGVCAASPILQKEIMPAYFMKCGDTEDWSYVDFHHQLSSEEIVYNPGQDKFIRRLAEDVFVICKIQSDKPVSSFRDKYLNFLTWCPDNRFLATVTRGHRVVQILDSTIDDFKHMDGSVVQEIVFDQKIIELLWDSADSFYVFFYDQSTQSYKKMHYKRVTDFAQKIIVSISRKMAETIKNIGRDAISKIEQIKIRYDVDMIEDGHSMITQEQIQKHVIEYLNFMKKKTRRFDSVFRMCVLQIEFLKNAFDEIEKDFGVDARDYILENVCSIQAINDIYSTMQQQSATHIIRY